MLKLRSGGWNGSDSRAVQRATGDVDGAYELVLLPPTKDAIPPWVTRSEFTQPSNIENAGPPSSPEDHGLNPRGQTGRHGKGVRYHCNAVLTPTTEQDGYNAWPPSGATATKCAILYGYQSGLPGSVGHFSSRNQQCPFSRHLYMKNKCQMAAQHRLDPEKSIFEISKFEGDE